MAVQNIVMGGGSKDTYRVLSDGSDRWQRSGTKKYSNCAVLLLVASGPQAFLSPWFLASWMLLPCSGTSDRPSCQQLRQRHTQKSDVAASEFVFSSDADNRSSNACSQNAHVIVWLQGLSSATSCSPTLLIAGGARYFCSILSPLI